MPEPKGTTEVISLRMPSRLELLGVLDRLADSVCERLRFDDDTRSQVSMSVLEAGTNAIQHGHHRDASKVVDIEFRLHADSLEVFVHDSGSGFDLDALNGDVTSPEHLLDSRGRGVFIMKSCMDRVEFSFSDRGTLVRLVKNRPGKAENA